LRTNRSVKFNKKNFDSVRPRFFKLSDLSKYYWSSARFFSYKSNGNGTSIAAAKLYVSLLPARKECMVRDQECREQEGQSPLKLTKRYVDLATATHRSATRYATYALWADCPRLSKRAEYPGTKYLYREAHSAEHISMHSRWRFMSSLMLMRDEHTR